MGVCRRVLGHQQDAEDAFQAAFFVFARKAASVAPRDLVGNWLYGVAHQTAVRARAINLRRQQREQQVPAMPEPEAPSQTGWDDLRPILDEELSRLPDRYRSVVVLCDVEGRTRKDAARHLGCPEGSVSSRLARARAMLAKRLGQRGVVLSAGSLATLVSEHATANLSATIVGSTIQPAGLLAAGGIAASGASPAVATLVGAVMNAMTVKKSIATASLVLVAALTLGGVGVGVGYLQADPVAGPPVDSTGKADPPTSRAPKVEDPVRREPEPSQPERAVAPAPRASTAEGPPKAGGLEGTWRIVETGNRHNEEREKATAVNRVKFTNNQLIFEHYKDPHICELIFPPNPYTIKITSDNGNIIKTLGAFYLNEPADLSRGPLQPRRVIYELVGDHLKLWMDEQRIGQSAGLPPGLDVTKARHNEYQALVVLMREPAPLGPLNLTFHKNIPESEIALSLSPGLIVSRMKEGLLLPLTIANHATVEIQTTLAHELNADRRPLTALYASAMPEHATKPGPFVPVYLGGVGPHPEGNFRLGPGKTKDIAMQMDWPGKGSINGAPLLGEPGWYRMRFLLVFEVSGKPQYVITLPTSVHVLPTDIPNAIDLLAGRPQKLERVAERSRSLWAVTSRWDTEFRQQPEQKFRELEHKAAELR